MTLDRPRAEDPYEKLPKLPGFTLTSTDISDGGELPLLCAATDAGPEARNLSPQLAWSGFPDTTRSFVVSCFDPDAPTPSGFWHWVVADIPASVTSLDTGAPPPEGAVVITSDGGVAGYAGALPPEGDHAHRYFFVVHAMPEPSLGVDAGVTPAVVAFLCAVGATARAQLVATLQR